MNGEVSRKSYKTYSTWDNRMQVVVSTIDGNKHVFNFINYNDDSHSHIVYVRYNNRVWARNYESNADENYGHSYNQAMQDWYMATEVSQFPYNFEQSNSFILDNLTEQELLQLKSYLENFQADETNTISR